MRAALVVSLACGALATILATWELLKWDMNFWDWAIITVFWVLIGGILTALLATVWK